MTTQVICPRGTTYDNTGCLGDNSLQHRWSLGPPVEGTVSCMTGRGEGEGLSSSCTCARIVYCFNSIRLLSFPTRGTSLERRL